MTTNLLERQIKKHLTSISDSDKKKMQAFFDAIEEAYESAESDRVLMERSLDISSEEMRIKNKSLEKQSGENKKIINKLIEAIKKLDSGTLSKKNDLQAYELSSYLKDLISQDIDNKKKIVGHEKETLKLNSELQKFKAAVDNASDFISILDKKNRIAYVNQSFLNYTEYTMEELSGKRMSRTLRKQEGEEELKNILLTLNRTKKPLTRHLRTTKHDGVSFMSEVNYTPVFTKSRKLDFYLLIERDITKELELDDMKNEFISIASHELRTPMTVIKGYNSILLTEKLGKINENQKKYFQRIASNIDRLINIVNDMLDLGRLESGRQNFNFEEFDIGKLLKSEIYDYFYDLCAKKDICLEVNAYDLKVISDSDKIKQVLINLIGNAYKFTKSGGRIQVSLTPVGLAKFKVSVLDNGVGVPQKNFANIFKKFYQVDNQLQKTEEGTGLGLPISKTIIESLGGSISVEKNPDESGSVFSFTLDINGRKFKA